MKVKLIKDFIDSPKNSIINSDMREYLLEGSMFWVFGIRFIKSTIYIYIFNEDHLFEVPLELFEVVEDNVSDEWRIKVGEEEITFWPDLFYVNHFLENFAEREYNERMLFESLRKRIEK